jgi:hypothetical protein
LLSRTPQKMPPADPILLATVELDRGDSHVRPLAWPPAIGVRSLAKRIFMCRNIKTLHNFKPPATDEEIRASALQFVRKLSGFTRPSRANEAAFSRAVDQVARSAHELLDSLVTSAPPRDREAEAAKARARGLDRFRSSDARRAT